MSLQARILPEDVAALAEPSIKALSVSEVLSITHAIDHQLSMMKRGVLGSDIVGFVGQLLSTGHLNPSTFPRTPTPLELQLCRKLARIEDSDIVTQLQIIRMLDVFRTLIVIFQRNLISVIDEELTGRTVNAQPSLPLGGGGVASSKRSAAANQVPHAIAARVDLTSDVCASASALTDDTLFATAYGGMIPTFVLYQLAERYGLDAKTCFHPYSAVSLLPTSDEAVLALRDMKEKETRQRKAAAGAGSADMADEHNDDLPPTAPAQAAAAAVGGGGARKTSLSNVVQKNSVVPVEFISPVVLTDTFTPLDTMMLRVFVETFGAFDPNDPHNQSGLSDELVDGHFLRVLPIRKFASVLDISVTRATQIIQNALEGILPQQQSAMLAASGASSARRRQSRTELNSSSVPFDEVDDVFGVWGDSAGINTSNRSISPTPAAAAASASHRPQLSKRMSFVAESGSIRNTPPPPPSSASVGHHNNKNTVVDTIASEALPSAFQVVAARGYIRFPEFELVIRYLNQESSSSTDSAKNRKEAQQTLVDELVARNSHNSPGSLQSPPKAVTASPQQSEEARLLNAAACRQRGVFAPSGEEEQLLIDGQAAFFEKALFTPEGTLRLTILTTQSPTTTASRRGGNPKAAVLSPTSDDGSTTDRKFTIGGNGEKTDVVSGGESDKGGISIFGVASSISAMGAKKRRGSRGNGLTETADASNMNNSVRGDHSPLANGQSAPLHGWAIHEHPPDRLDRDPMNGRDVNRLRRSFVASTDRTAHSYTTANPTSATNSMAQATTDGAADQAGSNAALAGVAQQSHQAPRRVVSARQRQLSTVLNLEKMRDTIDRIPEDPLALFSGGILQKGGAAHNVPISMSITAGGGPAGASPSTAAPSSLSIAALLQHGNDNSIGGHFATSIIGADAELEASMSTSKKSTAAGGPRSNPKAAARAAASNRAPAAASTGEDLQPTSPGLSASKRQQQKGDDEHNSESIPLSEPADPAAAPGDGGACAGVLFTDAQNDSARQGHRRSVPLRSTGIHANDWRSTHYIPKLPSESIGDYCHSVKRAGGGFGERGRRAEDAAAKTCGADAAAGSVEHPHRRREGRGKETQRTTKHKSLPPIVSDDGDQQTTSVDNPVRSTDQGDLANNVPPQNGNTKGPTATVKQTKTIRVVSKVRDVSGAPNTARSVAAQDPDMIEETRRSAQPRPPPRREAPPKPAPSTSRPARQPMVSPPVPPPRGHMAVMDSTRHHGGSMLSFIPAALAMDVMNSLDLRSSTYPNSNDRHYTTASGRTSLRGSLLEPIGPSGGRAFQPNMDGQDAVATDPLHEASMSRSREQMGKLRYS